MKKIALIVLFLMIIMSTGAMAATQIKPVTFEMSVDFTDQRAFKLVLPGGTEKFYTWDANETHTDDTFTHTVYHEYNEEDWCSSYSDISQKLNSLDGKWNQSVECAQAKAERAEYKRVKEIEEELRLKFEKNYEDCNNETESLNGQISSLESSLNVARNAQSELSTCKNDLADSEKKNQNTMIFSALAGIAVGYFMWGRKDKKGPSEQSEAGSYGDSVEYREQEEEYYNEPHY
jgi:ubiquitin